MSNPLAFAAVVDRLGKLIPRLASNHEGEVSATVAAIDRTLTGAGLDWHDLARRVAEPSFADVMASASTPPRSYTTHSDPSQSTRPAGPPPSSPKPKRQPPPWPTWATLSRFQRLAWMDVIRSEAGLMIPKEAEAFDRFYKAHYTLQDGWSRQDCNAFNRHV